MPFVFAQEMTLPMTFFPTFSRATSAQAAMFSHQAQLNRLSQHHSDEDVMYMNKASKSGGSLPDPARTWN